MAYIKRNKFFADAYDWGYFVILLNCFIAFFANYIPLYDIIKYLFIGTALICFARYATIFFRSKAKLICPYMAMVIIGLYNFTILGDAWVLYSIFIIIFSYGRDSIRFVYITYKTTVAYFVICLAFFCLGYILFPSILESVTTPTGPKYSMGYSSAQEAARNWIYIVFMLYFLKESIKLKQWIYIGLFSCLMLYLTKSDTIYFIIILFVLDKARKSNILSRIICWSSRFSYAFFALATYLLALTRHPLMEYLDEVYFSGRLGQVVMALNIYDISWFGNNIQTFEVHSFEDLVGTLYLDSGYGYLLLRTGCIFLVIIAIIIILSKTKDNFKLSVCLLLYSLMTLAENNILSPLAIFPVVIAYSSIYKGTRIQ